MADLIANGEAGSSVRDKLNTRVSRRDQIIAARTDIAKSVATGSEPTTTYRQKAYFPKKAQAIRLVYANSAASNGQASEVVSVTDINISAALEYPRGAVLPVTFSGLSSVTLKPGAVVYSDPVPIKVAAQGFAWVRSTARQSGGTVWPKAVLAVFNAGNSQQDGDGLGARITAATNASPIVITTSGSHNFSTGDTGVVTGVAGNTAANGTWTVTKVSATQLSLDGSTGNGTATGFGAIAGSDMTLLGSGEMGGFGGGFMFGPIAIVGQSVNNDVIDVVIIGDSIANDSGESTPSSTTPIGTGYPARALGGLTGNIAYAKLAIPGTRVSQFVSAANIPTQSAVRRKIMFGARYVWNEHGVNDIFSGGDSLATLQANTLSFATDARDGGSRFIQSTISPVTTSSDNWTTASGQTPAAQDSVRIAFNTWLRAGAPIDPATFSAVAVGTSGALLAGQAGHPIYRVVDPAALIEVDSSNNLSLSGGRWKITTATLSGSITSATSATLSTAWTSESAILGVKFSDGTFKSAVTFTKGSSTITWSGAVTAGTTITIQPTADGTHPNTLFHVIMSGCLDPATLE